MAPALAATARAAASASAAQRQVASSARAGSNATIAAAQSAARLATSEQRVAVAARAAATGTRQLAGAAREAANAQRSGSSAAEGIVAGLSGGLAYGAFTAITGAAWSMARGVTGAVGHVTASFVQATVSAFDFRTRATMAFQALRGNGELEFSKLKSLATEMGTSLEGTFAGIRALSAAGFGASQAEQVFKRLQDMKGIGLDQATLDRLVLAMSQIKGAGVLQGDELRQIQETGINVGRIWESMATSTGKTTAELKKMKEAGKLSADVAIAGIMDAMASMAGGREAGALGREMGRKTAEGFGQRVSLLKSLFFDRLTAESTGGISDLLGTLSTAADDAMSWLKSDDARAFFTEIGGGIKSMAADLGAAFQSDTARAYLVEVKELFLGAWHVGEGLWSVTKAFVQGWAGHKVDLDGTKNSLDSIAAFLKSDEASAGMRRLGEAASYVGEAVIFVATNFKAAADGARVVVGAFNGLVETVRSLATSLYEGGAAAAQSLIGGFVGGIFGGQGQVLAAAASVGQTALSAIGGALDAHSPSRKTFQLGGFATVGLAQGMIAANDNARRAAGTVASDVRAEMAAGLGVRESAGGAPVGMVGGNTTTTTTSRSIGPITIHINGNADERTIDDLEARLVDLLERVA
jgi:tape measure domain-containing protein